MISHRNVIANVMQFTTHESVGRKKFGVETQSVMGFLPFSHIYGLVPVAHCNTFRGDEVVVLPRFDLTQFLNAIERFKINALLVVGVPCSRVYFLGIVLLLKDSAASQVPPVMIRMLSSKDELRKRDLSSVRFLYTGAAPTGRETVEDLLKMFPKWRVGQGYGKHSHFSDVAFIF